MIVLQGTGMLRAMGTLVSYFDSDFIGDWLLLPSGFAGMISWAEFFM